MMKRNLMVPNRQKKCGGFTLTEVLLAVMIVGLIGVALASLTRAASKEGGAGQNKIILRNKLSRFVRTVREDVQDATEVKTPGALGNIGANGVRVLMITKGRDINRDALQLVGKTLPKVGISYCFQRGSDNTEISPSGAYRGGILYRIEDTSTGRPPSCTSALLTNNRIILRNVKYISSTDTTTNYPVPLFTCRDFHSLQMKAIVEVKSKPIVNEVIEEIFTSPMGSCEVTSI